MADGTKLLVCDGCGVTASPEHVADRIRRLELSTRYRPVHIGVLFVALAPAPAIEDDFYGPPKTTEFIESFLDALEIPAREKDTGGESEAPSGDASRLAEFQRGGYFLVYLSECPIRESKEPVSDTISRLAAALIRRIRFNYRPKAIAPLGQELTPLIANLRNAGIGPILTLDAGTGLSVPRKGDLAGIKTFREAVAAAAPRQTLASGI